MDDYIDPFLSSSSWSELNPSLRSSWAGSIGSHTNALLANSMEAYGGDNKNAPICMIPSPHVIGNVAADELDLHARNDSSSVFSDGRFKYLSQCEVSNLNSHPQHDNETSENNFPMKSVFDSSSASGSFGGELNTSCSTTFPHSALPISSSIESNGSEPAKFVQSLADAHSISSVPSMWPPYSGASSLMEQGKLQSFEFQGMESNADELTEAYIENDKYPHLTHSAASLHDCNGIPSNFADFSIVHQMKMENGGMHPHQQEQNGLQTIHLPSFAAGSQMNQACQQVSQTSEGNTVEHQTNAVAQQQATPANINGCNGAAKPRARARRGQATDPHSIAERLRREKIAERMKNLQELVPNSNKTDKASMLDEIIDYVKFLQLQVKVLSMSRLGAAGAVVPLITDAQAEGAGALHLPSVSQGGADLSDAQDSIAFEQEVVKLMESSVTTAMQYLQNKGLCLMPIALASAISSQKGSSSAFIPPDRRKTEAIASVNSQSDGTERNHGENGGHNGCNGSVIKQEEAVKSF